MAGGGGSWGESDGATTGWDEAVGRAGAGREGAVEGGGARILVLAWGACTGVRTVGSGGTWGESNGAAAGRDGAWTTADWAVAVTGTGDFEALELDAAFALELDATFALELDAAFGTPDRADRGASLRPCRRSSSSCFSGRRRSTRSEAVGTGATEAGTTLSEGGGRKAGPITLAGIAIAAAAGARATAGSVTATTACGRDGVGAGDKTGLSSR